MKHLGPSQVNGESTSTGYREHSCTGYGISRYCREIPCCNRIMVWHVPTWALIERSLCHELRPIGMDRPSHLTDVLL